MNKTINTVPHLESLPLKCQTKNYRGIFRPRCNAKRGCQSCWMKYYAKNPNEKIIDILNWIKNEMDKIKTMIRPAQCQSESIIEFVSYDGKYPNLCSGQLVMRVNGVDVKFPKYCLHSGGSVWLSNGYSEEHVEKGEWTIAKWPEDFPKELKGAAKDLVNQNIPKGCCGGCV